MKHQRKFVGCRIGRGVDPIILWLGMYLEGDRASTEAIAEGTGVAGGTIRHWINGRRSPQLFHLRAVLNKIGYDIQLVRLKR